MKRFYCDHCQAEMHYSSPEVAVTAVHHDQDRNVRTVLINGNLEVSLCLEVIATLIEQDSPGKHFAAKPRTIRRHADLCGACRWGLIEQLRAGFPHKRDTHFPPVEGQLDWGKPPD